LGDGEPGSAVPARRNGRGGCQVSILRPLERDDLPQVASLYESVSRSGSAMPPRGLAGYFERTLLDHPWVDPEIPSLVYLDGQGTVRGLIGSHVRRLSLEGRPIRMACGGQLVSDPAVRNRAAGTLLLRRFFAGPQDLTITDGATEATRRIWRGLGGSVGHLGSISWVRLFDLRAAGEQALERFGMAAWRPVVRPVLSAPRERSPTGYLRSPYGSRTPRPGPRTSRRRRCWSTCRPSCSIGASIPTTTNGSSRGSSTR
jgi:hypothetical protein